MGNSSAIDQAAPSVESAFVGATATELPQPRPGWGSGQAGWEKVRAIALERLDEMMDLEPKVLRGEKRGAIHDFRVASRRFQQAFDLLAPEEPSKALLRMRRRVARSRRAMSSVRSLDVFLRRTDRILARRRAPRREAWEAVREYIRSEREREFARAAKKLSKLRLSREYLRLRRLLEPEAFFAGRTSTPGDGGNLGEGNFPDRLHQLVATLWDRFDQASAAARESPAPGAIHAARLAAKRLRYLLEIGSAFETEHSSRAISILRRLQDLLGECHDYEVEEAILASMLARPDFLRQRLDLSFEILKLIERHRKAKKRLTIAFASEFDAAAREQLKSSTLALMAPAGRGASILAAGKQTAAAALGS